MKIITCISLIFFSSLVSYCQSVGINEDASAPNPSALVDIKSISKGLLIPRMSTAQRKAIASPAAGLLVFDLDKSTIYLFDGQKWQPMLFANSDLNNPSIARAASDGTAGDKFGVSVSISGDYAIIGAFNEDIATKADQGAAYIFIRQDGGWSQQSKLIASDGAAGDNFGNSVSISGDYAIVGAPKGAGAWFLQGAAYIFVRNGTSWTQQAKLNASDGIIGEYFGTSVSIDGNYAVIGAPNAQVFYANQGAAYVFMRGGTSWAQQSKLTYPGGQYNDYLGYSVSISGEYVIAGAPYFDWLGTDRGGAFTFLRTGSSWVFQESLDPNTAKQGDNFGSSVSMKGSSVIAGAPNHDGQNTNDGCAYVFVLNGASWNQQSEISPVNSQVNANFGSSVSIDGDNAVIGEIYEDVYGNNGQQDAGAAYIFHRLATSWNFVRTIIDGNLQPSGFFGSAVGVSGYNYIVGAVGKNNSQGEVNFLNTE
ncbi:MAG: FG-GAP repeat protein [Ferruginibacter sp.]